MAVSKPPAGTKFCFEFFRDEGGRLRCRCRELGIVKPVEKADGSKRYKFAKVFSIPTELWFGTKTAWRLQLAQEGETVGGVAQ